MERWKVRLREGVKNYILYGAIWQDFKKMTLDALQSNTVLCRYNLEMLSHTCSKLCLKMFFEMFLKYSSVKSCYQTHKTNKRILFLNLKNTYFAFCTLLVSEKRAIKNKVTTKVVNTIWLCNQRRQIMLTKVRRSISYGK